MVSKHKIGLGLAVLFSAALVVPVFADGASDFQVNVRKASGTVDDISKLIDNIHARVAAGGGASASDTAVAVTPPAGGGNTPAPAGRRTGPQLVAASCRCHTVGGAPKLTHIGADATHTAMWISQYVQNPKSKDPNSKMPAQRNIAAGDLRTISRYLATQK